MGAGIAGLATAAALAQRGWTVTVHERSVELRELGAGISLRENGVRALEALGILDETVARGERILDWELRDERQRLLSSGALDDHARFFTVTRPALHAADLVVGADGIWSTVRPAAGIESRVRDLEYLSYRTLLPRVPGDPVGSFPGYWSASRRIAIAGCGPDHVYVFLFCRPDDHAARELPGAHAEWQRAFPRQASVLARVSFDQPWRAIHEVRCDRWRAGRVVLVGDAAHAMAPTLGQAACIAMHCGVALAQALEPSGDPDTALAAWEAAQRPMVDATQRYGRAYVRMMTRWPHRLLSARSAVAWALSRSAPVQRRLAGSAPPLRVG